MTRKISVTRIDPHVDRAGSCRLLACKTLANDTGPATMKQKELLSLHGKRCGSNTDHGAVSNSDLSSPTFAL
jgi:hypothetical protein